MLVVIIRWRTVLRPVVARVRCVVVVLAALSAVLERQDYSFFWFAVLFQQLFGVFRLSSLFYFVCFWRNLLFFLFLSACHPDAVLRSASASHSFRTVSSRCTYHGCRRTLQILPVKSGAHRSCHLYETLTITTTTTGNEKTTATISVLASTCGENGWQGRWWVRECLNRVFRPNCYIYGTNTGFFVGVLQIHLTRLSRSVSSTKSTRYGRRTLRSCMTWSWLTHSSGRRSPLSGSQTLLGN